MHLRASFRYMPGWLREGKHRKLPIEKTLCRPTSPHYYQRPGIAYVLLRVSSGKMRHT